MKVALFEAENSFPTKTRGHEEKHISEPLAETHETTLPALYIVQRREL
jgi:hypothetical protein